LVIADEVLIVVWLETNEELEVEEPVPVVEEDETELVVGLPELEEFVELVEVEEVGEEAPRARKTAKAPMTTITIKITAIATL